jgi:exopolysaccharide biosynthesis polyprenyl glycosylphosphotransferase
MVGSESIVSQVFQKIEKDRNYNFDIKGYISPKQDKDSLIPYLGDYNEIPDLLKTLDLDGVIVSFSHKEHDLILPIIQQTEGKNIEIFYVPDILDILTSHFNNLEVNGLPLLQLKSFALSGWQGFIKRVFDIFVSALALIVLSPLFLIFAGLILLTSSGGVFYRQKRVTLDDKDFEMLKFRSMYVTESSKEGLIDVVKNDPRVTPLGKFLRRTSADELPQLWNVLKGDMSLVGPRPERRFYVELNKKEILRYSERHRVRAGITGWAQVNGLRQQDSMLIERIKFDLYYIENWSLWFDIKIILLTFRTIVRGENAY